MIKKKISDNYTDNDLIAFEKLENFNNYKIFMISITPFNLFTLIFIKIFNRKIKINFIKRVIIFLYILLGLWVDPKKIQN